MDLIKKLKILIIFALDLKFSIRDEINKVHLYSKTAKLTDHEKTAVVCNFSIFCSYRVFAGRTALDRGYNICEGALYYEKQIPEPFIHRLSSGSVSEG